MEFKDLPVVKDQIMKCVRCGKCRSVCPVFKEVQNETAAPRGHVFMVQMLRDGVVEPDQAVYDKLSACLLCETCTVDCPSGIDVHELNAAARSFVYANNPQVMKDLVLGTVWAIPPLLRFSAGLMGKAQKLGLLNVARDMGLTRLLPGDLKKAEKIYSEIPSKTARSQITELNPSRGEKKYTVGYFLGCGTDLFNPQVALATIKVLTASGCEVIVPQQSRCCGMPQIANGKLDTARQLAAFNVRVFEQYKCDYIISDCASCSSALAAKNMEFLFQGTSFLKTALEFSAKVMDLTKFLADVLEMKFGFDDSKQTQEPIKITYHDPCHLANAQKIKKQPRDIINSIPGVKLIEMKNANSCCGGSGTYSMTHYDLSMQILDKKMESIRDTGADIIATSCPSCTIQLKHGVKRHGLPCQVVHPVELLSRYC